MELVGSIFRGGGKPGDFRWMLGQPEYDDALFVFNDNEEQFYAHRQHPAGAGACSPGGGNAAIRPYQCQDPPRATGIPTGSRGGGYPRLDDHVRQVIDDALAALGDLLATGRYRRVIYSAENERGDLGTGIFRVGDDVKRFIVDGLRRVTSEH